MLNMKIDLENENQNGYWLQGSRALPKVPIEEDSQLNTPDSYEVVDSGVKPFGFHKQQLHHQQHPGVAEVHGSNPSLDNTPIAMRKQRTPGSVLNHFS